MLQRKQSLYLLLAGIFIFLLFFVPYWKTSDTGHEVLYYGASIETLGPEDMHLTTSVEDDLLLLLLCILAGGSAVFSFLLIFLYPNRVRQAALAVVLLSMHLLTGIVAGWMVLQTESALVGAGASELVSEFQYGALFPIVSALLTVLARKGILADESLVRSMDRLR
jgi:hypothetical protein